VFLWYLILHNHISKLYKPLSFMPEEFTPLLIWLTFLAYILCPFKGWFNYQGR
jgi:hypothetical protein